MVFLNSVACVVSLASFADAKPLEPQENFLEKVSVSAKKVVSSDLLKDDVKGIQSVSKPHVVARVSNAIEGLRSVWSGGKWVVESVSPLISPMCPPVSAALKAAVVVGDVVFETNKILNKALNELKEETPVKNQSWLSWGFSKAVSAVNFALDHHAEIKNAAAIVAKTVVGDKATSVLDQAFTYVKSAKAVKNVISRAFSFSRA